MAAPSRGWARRGRGLRRRRGLVKQLRATSRSQTYRPLHRRSSSQPNSHRTSTPGSPASAKSPGSPKSSPAALNLVTNRRQAQSAVGPNLKISSMITMAAPSHPLSDLSHLQEGGQDWPRTTRWSWFLSRRRPPTSRNPRHFSHLGQGALLCQGLQAPRACGSQGPAFVSLSRLQDKNGVVDKDEFRRCMRTSSSPATTTRMKMSTITCATTSSALTTIRAAESCITSTSSTHYERRSSRAP